MVLQPSVLSFCSLFKTKISLHILDKGPMKTFGPGQSSKMSEHKTKQFARLRPDSTSIFALLSAPLKFAEYCYVAVK